jgi:hypothetical protein
VIISTPPSAAVLYQALHISSLKVRNKLIVKFNCKYIQQTFWAVVWQISNKPEVSIWGLKHPNIFTWNFFGVTICFFRKFSQSFLGVDTIEIVRTAREHGVPVLADGVGAGGPRYRHAH